MQLASFGEGVGLVVGAVPAIAEAFGKGEGVFDIVAAGGYFDFLASTAHDIVGVAIVCGFEAVACDEVDVDGAAVQWGKVNADGAPILP